MINCKSCSLHKFRKNIVPGRGSFPADVLIMGEAPGKTEDLLGEAFVGDACKVLDALLEESKLDEFKFYIVNTVLCRPTDCIGGDNRQPTTTEVFACRSNVMSIVNKVKPQEIILAGKIAETYYKNEFKHYSKIMHPAAILRHGGIHCAYYQDALRECEKVYRRLKG